MMSAAAPKLGCRVAGRRIRPVGRLLGSFTDLSAAVGRWRMMGRKRASMPEAAHWPSGGDRHVLVGERESTIGTLLLAGRLQWEFQDGDWFHPARECRQDQRCSADR